MANKVLFTADLHGYEEQYKKLFEVALQEGVQSIIIGGDLAAKKGINPPEQEIFLGKTLPSMIKDFKNKSNAQIYLMFGNDDVVNSLLIENYDGSLWNNIQDKRLNLTEDYELIGYPYIPISPFQVKNFEKFDINSKDERKSLLKKIFGGESFIQPGASLQGEVWNGKEWINKIFDKKNMGRTIEDDLNVKNFLINPTKSIYVFHCPPYNTPLDVIPNLINVGSKAIRNFIEKNQPYLTLTGHVHETVNVTGKYATQIGNSLVMTAGNGADPSIFSYLTFNLENPKTTKERKTIKI